MASPSPNRSRWPTSLSIGVKLPPTGAQVPPLIATRKKWTRPNSSHPASFSQRMAKTKSDVEELFKLYYSNSLKFDSFERQIVTGTRIPSARVSSSSQLDHPLTESSTSVFNSKHCVSREMIETTVSTTTTHVNDTQDERLPMVHDEPKEPVMRRFVQVRLDYPAVTSSPRSPWHLAPTDRSEERTEPSLDKSITSLEDLPLEAFEQYQLRRSKTTMHPPRPDSSKSSSSNFPPGPPPSLLLMSPVKESTQASRSSFSNYSTIDPAHSLTPIITGKAVNVRARSSNRPSGQKTRPKSTNVASLKPPRNLTPKTFEMPEFPNYLTVQRVVSIPSKCSRYVLVSFPQTPMRYKPPSYMERLLLPERFPTLFQNIVQSYDHSSQQ